MTVINTNSSALRAQNGSRLASATMQTAMTRLSTGKRINSAKDDAAGLAIASSMTSSIRGMNQAIRNANDGISLASTAEGSLNEVTNMLQRIRELAVESASGTYSDDDRTNLNAEVTALTTQIGSIVSGASFNGNNLFTVSTDAGKHFDIQTGSSAGNTVTVNIAKLDKVRLVTGGAAISAVAAAAGPPVVEAVTAAAAATAVSVSSVANANATLATVDDALKQVNTVRAGLGASQSQLTSVANNLTDTVNNLSDARSQIQDTDFSTETTNLASAQILSQAATAMLAQANQSQQNVLSLLRQ